MAPGALRKAAVEGDEKEGCFMAGQICAIVKKEQTANEIIQELISEAKSVLEGKKQMGNIAFVFSGQGSQYSTMGKELYDYSDSAKEIFEMAEKIRNGTKDLCFSASKEELSETINTQPALFCVDLGRRGGIKGKRNHPENGRRIFSWRDPGAGVCRSFFERRGICFCL